MFKVDFFVDDRKLGDALRALQGLAHGAPVAVPVVNAVKKGNGLAAKTNGDSLERFAEALKQHKGKTVKAADIIPLMKSIGLSAGSRTYILTRAVAAKLLKRSGKGAATTYKVA